MDSVSLIQEYSLISSPPPSPTGSYCLNEAIDFTCIGIAIPLVLDWKINGTIIGTYSFRSTDQFPKSVVSQIASGVILKAEVATFPNRIFIEFLVMPTL